jgi:hypothetical protein
MSRTANPAAYLYRSALAAVLLLACGECWAYPPMGQLPSAPRPIARPATLGGAARAPRSRTPAAALPARPAGIKMGAAMKPQQPAKGVAKMPPPVRGGRAAATPHPLKQLQVSRRTHAQQNPVH